MPSNNHYQDKISVLIFSHDAEKEIAHCIKSAKLLTDKIYLIDIQSKDKTIKIAKEQKVVIYLSPYSQYVEPAREYGIKKAQTDWVFILDADERITPALAQEIQNLTCPSNSERRSGKSKIQNFTHYKIPRKNIFGNPPTGRWLKHGGWWPDYQIRLINKKYYKSWPKEIHSTPQIEGNGANLNQPLLHYFHGDFASMVNKTIVFEDIESDLLFKAGKTANSLIFFRKFNGELFRRLIKNLGFLDGSIGIIESIYQAFSKTITYLFLYEKLQSRVQRDSGKLNQKSRVV